MDKIKIGIIGGAGYTAGELLRILLGHPNAEVVFIHSSSNFGKKVYEVHTDLVGDTDLVFNEIDLNAVDVVFLCMGHGKSKEFMEGKNMPAGLKVIDLSHDFRLKSPGNLFVYGLPELNKESIKPAQLIANPGCFATAIQLALLPLANKQLLNGEVHVNAITGSTGAGQSPTSTSHFSWRNNNISIYKAFGHQHLGEITESLVQLMPGFNKAINFLPVRGNFARGIFASIYLDCKISEEKALKVYCDYYKDEPFVNILKTNPDLKQVVNSNKCILHVKKYGDKILIISIIDNLVKGASGQAVQNMNLMFGLDEKTGLDLKSVAF